MKKVIYSILITLLLTPVLVCASTFSNSESLTKRYIKNFLYPERYMKVDSGDFISREEVEKTMVRKDSDNRLLTVSSYMYDGTKFWAKNRYVIAEKIEQRPQNENYKTKITQIVNHDTKVKGTGKFTDPWIFVDSFKVTVKVGAGEGTVDSVESVTKNVDAFGKVSFVLEPKQGYRYLNNTCGVSVTGSTLEITNVEKDMECEVNFDSSRYSNTLERPYKVVHLDISNSDVTYWFDPAVPNTFSARYLLGYYTDDTLKTRVGKLTNVPYRKGWKFNGYYVNEKSPSQQIVNSTGFFETRYSLLKDNENTETILFDVEPLKFKITFLKQDGEGGTSEVVDWPYEHDMPKISRPTRVAYTFEGYYTGPNGTGDRYYNADGTESRIFNPDTPGNLTLYANWAICPVGSYCPGDNVAYRCPNGYTTATTGSVRCTQCRFWDACNWTSQDCVYGCDTCYGSYQSCTRKCCERHGSQICDEYDCGSSCSTVSYSYSCNCSSCHHRVTTCHGEWVYITDENACTGGGSTEYAVNLDKKGGTGGTDSYVLRYYGSRAVSVLNGDINSVYLDVPTKEGYIFDGYYTRENGGGEKVIEVEKVYKSTFNSNQEYTQNELNNQIEKFRGFVILNDLIGKGANKTGSTITIYANWTPCPKGNRCPGDNKKYLCGLGKFQDEEGKTTCKNCVAGSYSAYEGADKCFGCGDGVTNTGANSICPDDCPNKTEFVKEWVPTTWNSNNTVSNLCTILSCKTGYRLENNVCVLNNVNVTILAYPGGTVQVDGGTSYNIGSNAKSSTVSLSIGSHTFKDSHTGTTKTITVSDSTTQVVVGYYIGSIFGDLQLGTLRNNGERYDEPKTSSEYTIPSGNYTKMQIYAKAYILQYLYGARKKGYDVYAPDASASFAITSTLTEGNLTTCKASLGWGNAKLGPSDSGLYRTSSDCSLNKTVNFNSTGGIIKFTFKSYGLAQSAQTAYGDDIAKRFKILARSRALSAVYIY